MRRILPVVAALAVLVAWYLFLISPRDEKIDELGAELEAAEEEEQRLQGTVARLKRISEAELTYQAAIVELEGLIPPTPELDVFIEEVSALANTTGVDLLALAPAFPAQVEGANFSQIEVTIGIEGQFFEVLGFLFGLSDMERLIVVDSVDIRSVEEEGFTRLSTALDTRLFTLTGILPTTEAGLGAAALGSEGAVGPGGDGQGAVEESGPGGDGTEATEEPGQEDEGAEVTEEPGQEGGV